MNGDAWLNANWSVVEEQLAAETEHSQVAQRLLPKYMVPEQALFVSLDRFDYASGTVDEQAHVDIERFEENLSIPKLQIDSPDPAHALVAVHRAAQRLARRHDQRVLRVAVADEIAKGQGQAGFEDIIPITALAGSFGEGMLLAVAAAISQLDDNGYRTGYAVVASNAIWTELHRRGDGSFTLPVDAVKALIDNGPIHRSSVLQDGDALVMSLGEGRIDRAVAEMPRLAFVDQDVDLRRFDLYERFVPRFRETLSVVLLRAEPYDESK